ncbi:MAG TPA: hypothetical protein PLU58_06700 [Saprospiraceae bacterium]|nr:hypothetical protein [Saprospiraceae bacterium]
MTKQIFINLPVKNLEQSVNFYKQLGFSIYPLFTFNDQKCMAWGEQILVMLHSKEFFNSDNKKQLIDPREFLIPSFSLPVESLEKVNSIMERGLKVGGKEPDPMIDEGFMQIRTIKDFDGYCWGIIYLDLNKFRESQKTNG